MKFNLLFTPGIICLWGGLAFAQPSCPSYTSTGTNSSPYVAASDPACAICPGSGATGPWSGAGCAGQIVSTSAVPVTTMALAYTAVNNDDYATITINGGGTPTIVGTNVGVAGNVIGPYLCSGLYGDVFITVTSTLPFTSVTLTNTGCASGWVIACPGFVADAGLDNNSQVLCGGTLNLNSLLSSGTPLGGIWTETTISGQFNPLTGVFNSGGLTPGNYDFSYFLSSCGSSDVANFSVAVGVGGDAGDDNSTSVCNVPGTVLDLNQLLSGADPGGIWTETTSSAQFNEISGALEASGLAAGAYQFTYSIPGIAPCATDFSEFVITVNQQVFAGADSVISTCNAAGIIDLNLLLTDASPGGTWSGISAGGQFDPFTALLNVDNLVAANYLFSYSLNAVSPCANDVANFAVAVSNVAIAGADNSVGICNSPGFFIDLNTLLSGNNDPGTWQPVSFCPNDKFDAVSGVLNVDGLAADDYTFRYTVYANAPCVNDTAEFIIHVYQTPEVNFMADRLMGCEPFVPAFTSISSPTGIACEWSFGDGITEINCTTFSHVYEVAGIYNVGLKVTTVDGCMSQVEFPDYIEVSGAVEASFSFNAANGDVLNSGVQFENHSVNAETYSWNFGDNTSTSTEENPLHLFPETPNENYFVQLHAENEGGCADSTSAMITISDAIVFYIPNAFTPDGNSFNETFQPVFYSGFDPFDFHLSIFDRWGDVVFESFNAAVGWNGTYAKEQGLVEDGIYVWQIEFGETMSDKRHSHRGHVTVLK